MAENTLNLQEALSASLSTALAKATTGSVLSLGEQQINQVVNYISQNNLFFELTKNNLILDSNSVSMTVLKQQASKFQQKTQLGTGTLSKWRLGEKVTVQWKTPQYAAEGFTYFEKKLSPAISIAKKIEKITSDYNKNFERTAFLGLEDKVKQDNKFYAFDWTTKNATEIYQKIVGIATEITQTYDELQGIDGIEAKDIVILLSPIVFDKLVFAGMMGNNVKEIFEGGQYRVSSIGGYKILSCPYLTSYYCIVTTNFVAAGGVSINAINSGKIDQLSNDEGVYFEAMICHKIIWDKLAHGLYKTTNHTEENAATKFVVRPKNATAIVDPN